MALLQIVRLSPIVLSLFLWGCFLNFNDTADKCNKMGEIDFIYIQNSCESCIELIEKMLTVNEHIFDYNIMASPNQNLLINICYNKKILDINDIENSFKDAGFNPNFEVKISDFVPECCHP
tara:strand:- start:59 stop:421 length:363 start_codon:yes stop_codon:yes gene_type:complete